MKGSLKKRGEITRGNSEAHCLTCKSPQCRTDSAWGYLLKAQKKLSPLYYIGIVWNETLCTWVCIDWHGSFIFCRFSFLEEKKNMTIATELWLTQNTLPAAFLAGHAFFVIWILHLPWEHRQQTKWQEGKKTKNNQSRRLRKNWGVDTTWSKVTD